MVAMVTQVTYATGGPGPTSLINISFNKSYTQVRDNLYQYHS